MCEDYPCCGHDICPDQDASGRQTNMRCTCGAKVPLTSRSSLCRPCLTIQLREDQFQDDLQEYNRNEANDYTDE